MLSQSRFVERPPEKLRALHVPRGFLTPPESSSESESESQSQSESESDNSGQTDARHVSNAVVPAAKKQKVSKEAPFVPFSREYSGGLCYKGVENVHVVPSLTASTQTPSHALMMDLVVDAERSFERRAMNPTIGVPDPDRAFLKEMKGVIKSDDLRALLFAPGIQTEENEYNIHFAIASLFESQVPEYSALPKFEQRKDRAFIGIDRPWVKKQFNLKPQMKLSIYDYSRMVHVIRTIVVYCMYGTLRSTAAQSHSEFDMKWLANKWDQLVEITQREVVDTNTNEPRRTNKGHVITQSALQFLPRIMALYRLVKKLDEQHNTLDGMVNDLDKDTVQEIEPLPDAKDSNEKSTLELRTSLSSAEPTNERADH